MTKKRVAAYARVSGGTEVKIHSLAAQVSHYSKYIQSNSEWDYAGIYAEADEPGTKNTRPEFQRLLADCRAGKIDIILTKALSRFARNTVTLLETIRELKALGINVIFEEQNIETLSGAGELLLTLLAGFAQEESHSVSENIKWRRRKDMESGKTKPLKVFGYKVADHKLVIVPEQAEIIRLMFDLAMGGKGARAIANELNRRGIPSAAGLRWSETTVRHLITNPKMCGDLLHQRNYVADHVSKKMMKNRGELPMYRIEDTHEGIVPREIFEAVQDAIKSRSVEGALYHYHDVEYRKRIKCAVCGRTFIRRPNGGKTVQYWEWKCWGKDKRNKSVCNAQNVTEPALAEAAVKALGLEEYSKEAITQQVECIIAGDGQDLTFILHDGREIHEQWQYRPREGRRRGEKNNGNPGYKN